MASNLISLDSSTTAHWPVIPAQARIQSVLRNEAVDALAGTAWIPACAGMTVWFRYANDDRRNSSDDLIWTLH